MRNTSSATSDILPDAFEARAYQLLFYKGLESWGLTTRVPGDFSSAGYVHIIPREAIGPRQERLIEAMQKVFLRLGIWGWAIDNKGEQGLSVFVPEKAFDHHIEPRYRMKMTGLLADGHAQRRNAGPKPLSGEAQEYYEKEVWRDYLRARGADAWEQDEKGNYRLKDGVHVRTHRYLKEVKTPLRLLGRMLHDDLGIKGALISYRTPASGIIDITLTPESFEKFSTLFRLGVATTIRFLPTGATGVTR